MTARLNDSHCLVKHHKFVKENKENPTSQEIKFKDKLNFYLGDKNNFPRESFNISDQYAIKHPRGFYIIDIFLPALRIGFEIDGGIHWQSENLNYDLIRKNFLEETYGIKLYSIPNSLVDSEEKLEFFFDNRIKNITQHAINRWKLVCHEKRRLKKKLKNNEIGELAYKSLVEKFYVYSFNLLE